MAKKKKEVKRIYAGASLPGLRKGTVFKGGIPAEADKPFIRDLCVPIGEYPAFLKKVGVSGTRENYCYKKSLERSEE